MASKAGAPGAEGWLSWLSPLGWVRLTRAFAGEQWWVFMLFTALVITLTAVAFVLSLRRDLGTGLLVGVALFGFQRRDVF